MAAIPDFTALPQAVPQPAGGTAAFEPPNWRQVGMAGESVASAGRTLESASDIVAQANARQDDLVAQAGGNTLAQTKTRLQWDPKIGFANVLEGNAVGPKFIDDYLQRFDTAAASIRENLQSPAQQKIFDQHAQLQRAAYQQSLFEHQSQQTEKFNDSTDDATIQNALSDVAQRPMDDFGFQRGLVTINGVIDKAADRKGLPAPQVDQLKQHYLDAALSSRVLSISQGIPGVQPANPYVAEKYFDQMQSSMGPAARLQLGAEVQKAIVPLQQDDRARSALAGSPPLSSDAMRTATQGTPPLAGVVRSLETGGLDNPDAAVSPKGAQGAMQVMPQTAANPGLGVRPAQLGPDGKPLPGELDRVGSDMVGALTARYDQPALVLAAYNAGYGNVDKWIAKYGDPRAGQVSTADWIDKIPFQETKSYVERGLAKIPGPSATPGAAPPVTGAQLEARLPALAEQARQSWLQDFPNDVVGAEGVASRVMNYGGLAIRAQTARQQVASETLTQSLLGPAGDGKNAPQTFDQAVADPMVKAAYDQAAPEVRRHFVTSFAQGDKQFDDDSLHLYYTLKGVSANDPESFGKVDLGQYFGKMPVAPLKELIDAQTSINKKDLAQQNRNLNWKRALGDVQQMIAPIIDPKVVGEATSKALMNQFSGRFSEALQQFHDANNKWPDTPTTQKIAGGLIAQGSIAGSSVVLSDDKERFFQAQSEGKTSKFYVPLPSKRSGDWTQLQTDFATRFGRPPKDDAELQAELTKHVLATGQTPPWMSR